MVKKARFSPDPLFYGWRIFDKRNVSTLADNFPNMRRTSSVRARKKQMDKLEKFMQEEAHRSYDIFTGTRKETEVETISLKTSKCGRSSLNLKTYFLVKI